MVAVNDGKLKSIAYQTFEITCYMFPLEEWELEEEGVHPPGADSISAFVRFDGAAEGAMKIRVTPELFDAIAENMLGMEEGDDSLKEGALCEIANIICGNMVPVFAKGDNICYIRPPEILDNPDKLKDFKGLETETVQVYLDEGVAEITVYLKSE